MRACELAVIEEACRAADAYRGSRWMAVSHALAALDRAVRVLRAEDTINRVGPIQACADAIAGDRAARQPLKGTDR